MIFAASFWIIVSICWSAFYPAALETRQLRELGFAHSYSIEQLNQLFSYERCDKNLPQNPYLTKIEKRHRELGAFTALDFKPRHAYSEYLISSVEFKSFYKNSKKEILSYGLVLSDRKSSKCFGVFF